MSNGKKSTYSYKFVEPQLKALRELGSRLVLDNIYGFKKSYVNLMSIFKTKVNIMAIHTLVQFYDPPLRCFTFQDYPLAPTLVEYSYILGIEIKDQVPFNISKELPKFHQIVKSIHLGKKGVKLNLKPNGGTYGFTMKFLMDKATTFADT